MFEDDFADMFTEKCPLMIMVGRAEGLACADPGARNPIAVSGIVLLQPITRFNHHITRLNQQYN